MIHDGLPCFIESERPNLGCFVASSKGFIFQSSIHGVEFFSSPFSHDDCNPSILGSMNTRELVRLANRVELSANFAGSSNDRLGAEQAVAESLSTTIALLDLVDPFWLRDVFAEAKERTANLVSSIESSEGWRGFLSTKTDLMHQVGVHQKAIERLGTLSNEWDRSLISYDQLVESLESLACLLADSENRLHPVLIPTENTANRMFQLANALYGIALIAGSEGLGPNGTAILHSSAKLVVDNIHSLGSLTQERVQSDR